MRPITASRAEAFAIGEHVFPRLAMVNLSFLLFFLRREQGRLRRRAGGIRRAWPGDPRPGHR